MNYSEAVALALRGEEQGYQYLYEESYKSKYYLALQYMKNKEAAEDVLQDAYLKAFNSLNKLQEPEAFEKWLGVIVANTAKNALVKKNPILFTDVAVDDDGEEFTYDVEDENPENQPELAYTREETRELVHELMDSLSEEQRMCILMFHIEGASISEIAETMDCSENTVKSRLNYGRKNIKAKAEELQKKGYKLYSIAPVLLLVYLLRSDAETVSASAGARAAQKALEEKILENWREQQNIARQQQNAARTAEKNDKTSAGKSGTKAATNTAKKAAKTGLMQTAAGKAAAVVVAVCVAGGAFYGGIQWSEHNNAKPETTEKQEELKPTEAPEITEAPTETPEPTAVPEPTEAPEVTAAPLNPTDFDFTPEGAPDFAKFMEGELTEDELDYVLAYGPDSIPADGFNEDSLSLIMNSLCQGTGANGETYITNQGWDDQSRGIYSTAEVNRFISVFTDYKYTGDTVAFYIATLNYEASAEIASMAPPAVGEDNMNICYHYRKVKYDDGEGEQVTDTYKIAVTRPTETGRYRIVEIRDASPDEIPEGYEPNSDDHPEPAPASESSSAEAGSVSAVGIRSVYEGVLAAVQNGQYSFPQNRNSSNYQYFVADINGDGIQELVVGPMMEDSAFYEYDMKVFTCTQTDSGYQAVEIAGDQIVDNLYIAGDGNGLFEVMISRGTGLAEVHRITIGDGSLAMGGAEQSFGITEQAFTDFTVNNPAAQWQSVSDLSGLDGLQ